METDPDKEDKIIKAEFSLVKVVDDGPLEAGFFEREFVIRRNRKELISKNEVAFCKRNK